LSNLLKGEDHKSIIQKNIYHSYEEREKNHTYHSQEETYMLFVTVITISLNASRISHLISLLKKLIIIDE
jgi:hypothetical protein